MAVRKLEGIREFEAHQEALSRMGVATVGDFLLAFRREPLLLAERLGIDTAALSKLHDSAIAHSADEPKPLASVADLAPYAEHLLEHGIDTVEDFLSMAYGDAENLADLLEVDPGEMRTLIGEAEEALGAEKVREMKGRTIRKTGSDYKLGLAKREAKR